MLDILQTLGICFGAIALMIIALSTITITNAINDFLDHLPLMALDEDEEGNPLPQFRFEPEEDDEPESDC